MPENTEQVESGTSAAGTQEAGPAQASGSGHDYEARLRSDHEFAAKMAKEHQARADRAEQENRTYRSFRQKAGDQLANFVETVGDGTTVYNYLTEYDALLKNPEIQQAINAYRTTGKLELPNGGAAAGGRNHGTGDDEEYLSTEEKEIRQLKQQNQELLGRLGSVELGVGRNLLQGHLEKVFSNYALEPAQVETVKKHMGNMLEQFQRTGNIKGIQDLQGPNAYMMVRSMALAPLDDEDIKAGAERARLRKKSSLSRFSTDGPFGTAKRGEPPPVLQSAREAIEWAAAHPDEHDSY